MNTVGREFDRLELWFSMLKLSTKEVTHFPSHIIYLRTERIGAPCDWFSGWRKIGVSLMTPLVVQTHWLSDTRPLSPSPSVVGLWPLSCFPVYMMIVEVSEVVLRVGDHRTLRTWHLGASTVYPRGFWNVQRERGDGTERGTCAGFGTVAHTWTHVRLRPSNWDTLTLFRVFELVKSRGAISFVYPLRVLNQTKIL